MYRLLGKVEELKKSKIRLLIDKRIKSFKKLGKKSINEIYKELCFCILTANFNAERGIKIQQKIGNGFVVLDEKRLERELRKNGYRFPKTRAHYIVDSRKRIKELKHALKNYCRNHLREWIVRNIKGLGFKEASHFLRNIGYDDYAIIDFHIIDVLKRERIIRKPKTLSKKSYLNIEKKLKRIAKKLNLTLAELDLYLWYLETGKVLK